MENNELRASDFRQKPSEFTLIVCMATIALGLLIHLPSLRGYPRMYEDPEYEWRCSRIFLFAAFEASIAALIFFVVCRTLEKISVKITKALKHVKVSV